MKKFSVIDDTQRTTMIDALLVSSTDQRHRFADRAAGARRPPKCRDTKVGHAMAYADTASLSHGMMGGHMIYLRRLNGELANGHGIDKPTTASRPVLLPRLNPSNGQDSDVFFTLTRDFFSSGQEEARNDLSQHNVTRFVYFLLGAIFSSGEGSQIDSAPWLADVAVALNDLNERFLVNSAAVQFHPASHEYYVNGYKMPLSVTKSLEQLFDVFNEEDAANRMIKSRNWARNQLFNQINYDESGNQRDKQTMCHLIKKEWKARRDRGTLLHDYIHRSYTPGTPPLAGIDNPGFVEGEGEGAVASPVTVKEAKHHAGNSKKEAGFVGEVPVPPTADARAALLWKKFHSSFAQYGLHQQQTAAEKATTKNSDAVTDVVAADAIHANSQPDSNLETINLLDKANVTAFARWNRLRLNDHWLLLASEYTVYDERAGLAGSIDAIFLPYPHRTDIVVLVDWKRCEIDFGTRYNGPHMRYQHEYTRRYPKCNYWKYAFQLNLYREMLERAHNGGLIVADMMIVNFLPDSEFPRTFPVPRIPEARLFLDDLRERNNNVNTVNLDALFAGKGKHD